ncbi:MAG: TIGR03435 family protein [Vicinamibacterales bacterium]
MCARTGAILLLALGFGAGLAAQQPEPLDFEVVSIKRNVSGERGNSGRTLPDGTIMRLNSTVRSFILAASPVNAVDVEGLPDWAFSDRYDVIAKPPANSTREQRSEMMRRMFADRFKLRAHVEERERDVFDLVLAREDGQLGPNITPSSADCSPAANQAQPPRPLSIDDIRGTCGTIVGLNQIVSGGTTLNGLIGTLGAIAGGRITNRTGLNGIYAIELTFSRGPQADPAAPPDDRPDIFTALQEQLGLKLVRGKAMLPVFVIDSIERPSEN